MLRKICLSVVVCSLLAGVSFAQPRTFDWVKASDEFVQLDPADLHAGRVYRPGPDGGNMHVYIDSSQPVTIAMAPADEWNSAQQHPEAVTNLSFSCIREHVVSTIYECHLPPHTPMVLLIRDDRRAEHVIIISIAAVIRKGAKNLIAANDLRITYFRWDCVANCVQPEFEWVRLVKEKYELTTVPKVYSLLTPEGDGQKVNVRLKAPVPMTVAVVPSRVADSIYADPLELNSLLQGATCKQRGVQSLAFDCAFDVADGPQSLVILPEV